MNPRVRMGYLESIVIRYREASKKQKTVILNPNSAIVRLVLFGLTP